ncbi:FAD-dependent oxidoreductase [Alteromonas gilva]|uniref:FAD-dependent oxidoreductase n=1 Tax=Alteromonas gilva TaxID=2987522 RepID=A0ABT5L1H4_9ALTE|nr:FAD-dependent oxidoreductase [Alteromonas gilva]MDC8830259.1 FAD-dependent oxidoreductase [Alteromonas gilva]
MSAKYPELGAATSKARLSRAEYKFVEPPELTRSSMTHVPVIIVGGGPVGLATAADLAGHGINTIILERSNTVSDGSRAICWAKRTLEILDRLNVGEKMKRKGVVWDIGKVFLGADTNPLYSFDLLADKQQKMPAFVNLQQFYPEEYLIELLEAQPKTQLRWQSEVVDVENDDDKVTVRVKTPAGEYLLSCDYLVAADGHRSAVRKILGLDFVGKVFEDNFLIADVRMDYDGPAERHFWFDPPFDGGQTALLHRQPDNIWRIDFQLGWNIDRKAELCPEKVGKKIAAFLGDDVEFEYEWVSIYTFSCLKMDKFTHNRVIFAGDAAHLVSPFGARGANGGIHDQDNLAWKLAFVLQGKAPEALLETYNEERSYGADENIRNSTRSTDFITPKTPVSRAFRDGVVELAKSIAFARAFVNSGRLSMPCTLDQSSLNTPDESPFSARQRPGSPCMDAPVTLDGQASWLLNHLGWRFIGLYYSDSNERPSFEALLATSSVPVDVLIIHQQGHRGMVDSQRLIARHYDMTPGTFYLIRPDQHIAARWREFDAGKVIAALTKATAADGLLNTTAIEVKTP